MDAWSRSLERLEAEFPPEDVHTWLKPLQADLRVDSLVLYAPNAFIVDQVRELYLARIRELLAHFAGAERAGFHAVGARLQRTAGAVRRQPGQPLHLRQLRRRPQQPAGPGRCLPGGAEAGRPCAQPAAAVRRHRPGQDPPDVRRRQRHAPGQPGSEGAVPAFGAVLQRDDPGPAGKDHGSVQAPVPAGGRAADR
ncbi:hypothetical protein G6F22_018076 [Rhizopus arrhizus]|nr:hypothetical protein G6F22_018076 [Rhizopus arrhizus]